MFGRSCGLRTGSRTIMDDRLNTSVADAIARESHILEQAVNLLRAQTPLGAWPTEIRHAFLGALAPGGGLAESRKALVLQRHLFGAEPAVAGDERLARNAAAERLRADLPGLVPYGAGRYLGRL